MALPMRRSRSNTSISTRSNRPLSRASTTSVHSFEQHDPTQNLQAAYQRPHQPPPQIQPYPADYQHHQHSASYAPLETALLQAAQHASQQEGMPLETVHQLMAYTAEQPPSQAQQQMQTHGMQAQPFDHNQAAQALHAAIGQPPQLVSGAVEIEGQKKKGSATGNATNDKELREMLVKNEGRGLKDVAAEVIATDRTSKAEKSKQLFAMLWLKSVCKTAKTSVPRNRVYSRYAERCATERVIPLNPASFGKLVRVIFPGIQTRRLGVRGESKYHYVDLALINDTEDDDVRVPNNGHVSQSGQRRHASVGARIDFNSMPRLPADTAPFPPQEQQSYNTHAHDPFSSEGTSKGRLFTDIFSNQMQPTANRSTSMTYEYEMKFPTPEQMTAEDSVEISLPDITPYLPPRTDKDTVDALVALYRTHCTSLVDSIRYCKEKQFFRLFSSFHGTLTVPVQKLFAMPEVAPWIRECDWMMYQKMIRNVSQLTLQVAPPPVLKFLDNVSKLLHPHISKVFHSLPLHVLEARLEPATLFAHLLRQMLRVNSTAHAAAVMLMGDQNRDQMWHDWKTFVNLKRIIENELPHSCGHEVVYNILESEIRGMLLPLRTMVRGADGNFYYQETSTDGDDYTNETVIDRIAAFLAKLPSRFPHVPARTLLHCVNAIGSAALREITVENGLSFQGWWLTKVFIDEMGQWLASLGGFLDHSPPNWGSMSYSPGLMGADPLLAAMTNGGSGGSNNESRYSSMDADFGPDQSFMSNSNVNVQMHDSNAGNMEINSRRYTEQYNQVSFSLDLDLNTSQSQQNEQNHDDSGIGLLEDGIDAKFAKNMHQTLKSHLTQLPAGVS
ncbi:hypothetical protein BCR34DRAFT_24143 [Clohesyomyces aquaticus]|uniref:RFX-type winged-helix domain-containing protein n=1 Tax=Clohesyomyces aquaticus TaxID=1231657 RepID=A0A1Y2A5B0_9PLEO|nr:hypothetical protein BCR34DRAFT_24143 [Clohesyomyces aquaticus]